MVSCYNLTLRFPCWNPSYKIPLTFVQSKHHVLSSVGHRKLILLQLSERTNEWKNIRGKSSQNHLCKLRPYTWQPCPGRLDRSSNGPSLTRSVTDQPTDTGCVSRDKKCLLCMITTNVKSSSKHQSLLRMEDWRRIRTRWLRLFETELLSRVAITNIE